MVRVSRVRGSSVGLVEGGGSRVRAIGLANG